MQHYGGVGVSIYWVFYIGLKRLLNAIYFIY